MQENEYLLSDDEIIALLKKEPASDLRKLQKMPYEWKVKHSQDVIRDFVEHEGVGNVYVSFSGGKDSTVLLHLVRSIYPDVPAVFANTGIEFPEQVKFVRSFPNVTEVYPVKHFHKIIKEDGIVFPSKEVAMYVKDARKGCRYAINGFKGLNIDGTESKYKKRFKKWAYIVGSGVKISPDCCELMKERPMRDYEKRNARSPIIGIRAEESFRRAVGWMKSGCNSFGRRHKSTPISLWLSSDVDRYVDENGITLSPMYESYGLKRTGCMFCPVPIAHGDSSNLEYARIHHPNFFKTFCIKSGLLDMLSCVLTDEKKK